MARSYPYELYRNIVYELKEKDDEYQLLLIEECMADISELAMTPLQL